jgi:hypothetical protein
METNKPFPFPSQIGKRAKVNKFAQSVTFGTNWHKVSHVASILGAFPPSKLQAELQKMGRVRAAHARAIEGRLAGVSPPLKGAFKPVKLPFIVRLGSYIVLKYSVSITYT